MKASSNRSVYVIVLSIVAAAAVLVAGSEANFWKAGPSMNDRRLSLHEMTAMEVVRKFAREHPGVATHILGQIVMKGGEKETVKLAQNILAELESPTDGSGCNLCQVRI